MNAKCENCGWRRKAENNPRSLMGRLWYWHTKFCPGWKAYQVELTRNKK